MAQKKTTANKKPASRSSNSGTAKKSSSSAKSTSTAKRTVSNTPSRSTGKSSSSQKQSKAAYEQQKLNQAKKKKTAALRTEAWEWVLFLITVLIAVCVTLGDKMGVVGDYLRRFFIGCFGFSAYLICFGAVLVMLIYMFAPGARIAGRVCSFFVLTILLSMFLHLINGQNLAKEELFAKATPATGGWVGGTLANLLVKLLGRVGTMIVVIGLALIMLLLIIGISYKMVLARTGRSAARKAQQGMDRLSEHAEENRAQREANREERRRQYLEEQERREKERREAAKPVRTPIKDGSVDIPILEDDAYAARKRRYLEERREEAAARTETKVTGFPKNPEPKTVNDTPATAPSLFDSMDARPAETEKKSNRREHIEPEKIAVEKQDNAYVFPPLDLLKPADNSAYRGSKAELLQNAKILEEALASFGVEAHVIQVNRGPAVTRYELQPKQGIKVSKIANLSNDIAYYLAAPSIRIEAPIPGKSAVGIEVPNKDTTMVRLREVIESDEFTEADSKLSFALGKDIDGGIQVGDIAKMPHLLIAGATGSGKSVCINSIIVSLIYKADPKDVRMILIDPKVVELSVYNGIPHLLLPVVTEAKKAAATLNWAVQEMTQRYKKFADANVRDIRGYNDVVRELGDEELEEMPQIVIIIDELADLMMVASKEVEEAICRLAQLARAAGIHLIIATQRPSVDVVTGLIKANIPSRLAFAVSSGIDSRTILDMVGAEKLLGRGDMLFAPIGASKPTRIQGTFISDKEVEAVVAAVKTCPTPGSQLNVQESLKEMNSSFGADDDDEDDDLLEQAIKLTIDKQQASISALQRAFRIGFNRAARLMDAMEERGIVGPQQEGSKPRKALITREEFYDNEDGFVD